MLFVLVRFGLVYIVVLCVGFWAGSVKDWCRLVSGRVGCY